MDANKAEVVFTKNGGSLTCSVAGEIDHHSSIGIRNKIDSLLLIDPPDKLIMDMSGVSFMDSSGLGLVLGRYTKATQCGIEFTIGKTAPAVRRMFDMAGLERMIKYEEDINQKKNNSGGSYEKK